MADQPINGNSTLAQQQSTLRVVETGTPCSLVTYTKATSVPPQVLNQPTYTSLPLGEKVRQLYLVEVPHDKSLASVLNDNNDKEFVYASIVFVQGTDMMVAIFRDKA